MQICDSCGDSPVTRVVDTPEWRMVIEDEVHVFERGHTLCAVCERLWIEGRRDEMVDRSFAKLKQQTGDTDPDVLEMMRLVQLPLWSVRPTDET